MRLTFANWRVPEAIVLSSSAGCPQRLRRGAEAGERGEPLGRDLGLRALVLLHDFVIENVHADALKLYNDNVRCPSARVQHGKISCIM